MILSQPYFPVFAYFFLSLLQADDSDPKARDELPDLWERKWTWDGVKKWCQQEAQNQEKAPRIKESHGVQNFTGSEYRQATQHATIQEGWNQPSRKKEETEEVVCRTPYQRRSSTQRKFFSEEPWKKKGCETWVPSADFWRRTFLPLWSMMQTYLRWWSYISINH